MLEGFHALKHALRFGAEVLEAVTPDRQAVAGLAADLAPDLAERLRFLVRQIPGEEFEQLCPSPPPTGVVALARRPAAGAAEALASAGPVVLLEHPAHLGNLGAAVRAAAAAGVGAVLTTGRHDPWHPEALRGSAGLHYALPTARIDRLPELEPYGRVLVAVHPDGEELRPGGVPERAVLAFGTERRGLSGELLGRAQRRLRIPMRAGVSSLNLATAVAVVCYNWRALSPAR